MDFFDLKGKTYGGFPSTICQSSTALSRQLCVPDIPSGEEGWGSEASDQSEGPQSVCEARALQDGGPPPSPRSSSTRGLDDKDGPKGCLPAGSNPFKPLNTSIISLGREILQVHLPTIQPDISAESFHEVNETSCRVSKAGW